MRLTFATQIAPQRPFDLTAEQLRGLEQLIDEGDALVERCPEHHSYTHRIIVGGDRFDPRSIVYLAEEEKQ